MITCSNMYFIGWLDWFIFLNIFLILLILLCHCVCFACRGQTVSGSFGCTSHGRSSVGRRSFRRSKWLWKRSAFCFVFLLRQRRGAFGGHSLTATRAFYVLQKCELRKRMGIAGMWDTVMTKISTPFQPDVPSLDTYKDSQTRTNFKTLKHAFIRDKLYLWVGASP